MADLRSRIIRPLFRRSSSSSARSTTSAQSTASGHGPLKSRSKVSLVSKAKGTAGSITEAVPEEDQQLYDRYREGSADSPSLPRLTDPLAGVSTSTEQIDSLPLSSQSTQRPIGPDETPRATFGGSEPSSAPPLVTVQHPTQEDVVSPVAQEEDTSSCADELDTTRQEQRRGTGRRGGEQGSTGASEDENGQQQEASLSASRAMSGQQALPLPAYDVDKVRRGSIGYFAADSSNLSPSSHPSSGMRRKLWVKRPGTAPTLITVYEDDLVDDAKDAILRKYGNSLGRSFDSPDVTLHIHPRVSGGRPTTAGTNDRSEQRVLGPEEPLARTLDAYFPDGQTINEALTIEVPTKRTPRHSPMAHYGPGAHNQHSYAYYVPHPADDNRPPEHGGGYFPPVPVVVNASPKLAAGATGASGSAVAPHAMSILNTGHVPPLPSPRAMALRQQAAQWPRHTRQNTSSPTSFNVPGQIGQC